MNSLHLYPFWDLVPNVLLFSKTNVSFIFRKNTSIHTNVTNIIAQFNMQMVIDHQRQREWPKSALEQAKVNCSNHSYPTSPDIVCMSIEVIIQFRLSVWHQYNNAIPVPAIPFVIYRT
eukprot:NODE_439_length_7399_cov_0.767397.p4 type:complete len:118 gc:universal NODE_439_length_7399_cov_0.767397:2127-1774(-)